MNTIVKTRHASEGIAAQVGLKVMGDEDKVHYMLDEHTPSNKTIFKFGLQPMLPFQCANMTQYFENNQINGSTLSCKLNKQCDFMGPTHIVTHWPAIKSIDRDVAYIWTNARAFALVKSLKFKMGQTSLFSTDGFIMALLATLTGYDREFAEELGLYDNLEDLKAASLRDMITTTPALGFGNQESPSGAVSIVSMAFNAISLDLTPATVYDLIVPIGSNKLTLANVYTLNTNIPLDSNCLNFEIASDLVYLLGPQKGKLITGYNEAYYREYAVIHKQTFPKSESKTMETVEFSCMGPTTWFAVTFQSVDDEKSKTRWLKLCDDNGEEYIEDFAIYQNNTAREDGLPPSVVRALKPHKLFHIKPNRNIYLCPYSIDERHPHFRGMQNQTNIEKKSVKFALLPHDSPVTITVTQCCINSWFTEKGSGHKVWESAGGNY